MKFSFLGLLKTILLSFSIFLTIIQPGVSFKCYQCNSATNPNCTSPRGNSEISPQECVGTVIKSRTEFPCKWDDTKEESCRVIQEKFESNNCTEIEPDWRANKNESKECQLFRDQFYYNKTVIENIIFSVCRKVVLKIYEPSFTMQLGDKVVQTELVKPRISRQCGVKTDDDHDTSCVSKRSFTNSQYTCSCTEEECNGSSLIKSFSSFLLVIFVICYILFYDSTLWLVSL